MRGSGYVARITEVTNTYEILLGKLRVRDHLRELDVYERILLKRISTGSRTRKCGLDSCGLSLRSVSGPCAGVNKFPVL